MLKSRILRILSAFCAVALLMSLLTFYTANADEPLGKMSSVYAYVLNDYMFRYGVMSTENAGDSFKINDDEEAPRGVVYSEVVDFDKDTSPYLVIFFADEDNRTASCHIWGYDSEKEEAVTAAEIDIDYTSLDDGNVGVLSLASGNGKHFVTYTLCEDDEVISTDYYTVINEEAFKYVNAPQVTGEVGVMDFSSVNFHSGVDISDYNANIGEFFDNLKNSVGDSISYEDITSRISASDTRQIEEVLTGAVDLNDFDIANYTTSEEYKEALNAEPTGDSFHSISQAYSLGDEMYYIRFYTEMSYYNYAILLRSDEAENGYQILKVRTDCIPLSDTELKQIKTDYDRNTLLYKKSKSSIKLTSGSGNNKSKIPKIHIEKVLSSQIRLPILCIGGGISIALLTILWVYLYSDND